MLFNSLEFLIYLPVVLGLYYASGGRTRTVLLLLASYWFYGSWDARFLVLLALSTVLDFACAGAIPGASESRKRLLVTISIVVNLGVLGIFKYFNFFVDSARAGLAELGLSALDSISLEVILPLGISFYTFQTMAYTIDVYRGSIQPCRNFVVYAVFVSYFPQLVAGPIERASRLLPQLQQLDRPNLEMVRNGLSLMLLGFFKKVVIGDALASPYVDSAFADPASREGAVLLLGACLFSIQIYADFSGYSDIARGVSRLLGIELMSNFEQPYLSRNISEFWSRWHISLSTWLRDYLYIPLGGSRAGRTRSYLRLMITMLLGGLWHGASWNFVIWGGLHGALLAAQRAWGRSNSQARGGPGLRSPWAWGGILATNLAVIGALVIFRAPDLTSAGDYLAGTLALFTSLEGWILAASIFALYFLLVALMDLAPYVAKRHEVIELLPFWGRSLAYALLGFCIWTAWPTAESPFIYFQF